MNTPPLARLRPRRHLWRWLLGSFAFGLLIVVTAVANVVTLSRDAAALRRAVVKAGDLDASTKVQVSTGPILLGLARSVTALIDDIPPEVKHGLAAVHKASVGVYDLAHGSVEQAHSRILEEADKGLRGRGWSRLLAVRNSDNTVVVYATDEDFSGSSMRVCVAVCNQEQLVIASATVQPEALMDLIERQL
ncbi:hypothetical protein MASR2M8_12540 [Opitutaceae bacterium]